MKMEVSFAVNLKMFEGIAGVYFFLTPIIASIILIKHLVFPFRPLLNNLIGAFIALPIGIIGAVGIAGTISYFMITSCLNIFYLISYVLFLSFSGYWYRRKGYF